MSTHVHRNGAHTITVQDEAGHELTLVTENQRLQVVTTQGAPSLTPQTARDLADELTQWADCQQTARSHRQPLP
ncbi:hypothetical protein [Microlunatus ginsengisoli]|uniref:hypothetical protein n=1 Tax=Microlunatus ginsengisoli TaxID=363863 RepID=UPI0031D93A23